MQLGCPLEKMTDSSLVTRSVTHSFPRFTCLQTPFLRGAFDSVSQLQGVSNVSDQCARKFQVQLETTQGVLYRALILQVPV